MLKKFSDNDQDISYIKLSMTLAIKLLKELILI